MDRTDVETTAKQVIGVAIYVHMQLGPGFPEKIYQRALYLELKKQGINLERESKLEIKWGRALLGYQIVDFVINTNLLVEIKATSEIIDAHIAQVVSYLKAADLKLGLILNFGTPKLSIKRVVNGY